MYRIVLTRFVFSFAQHRIFKYTSSTSSDPSFRKRSHCHLDLALLYHLSEHRCSSTFLENVHSAQSSRGSSKGRDDGVVDGTRLFCHFYLAFTFLPVLGPAATRTNTLGTHGPARRTAERTFLRAYFQGTVALFSLQRRAPSIVSRNRD